MEEDIGSMMHPQENILQVFFHLLWQKGGGPSGGGTQGSHTLRGVNIPPTIALNHSRPLSWYFTSKDGSIKMKSRQKLSSLNVVAELTAKMGGSGSIPKKGGSSSSSSKSQHLTDIAALLISADPSIEDGVTHRPMNRKDFTGALTGTTDDLLSGTLQAFVEPKPTGGGSCINNHMIVVNWTPNVMHVERRSNRLNMVDQPGNRISLEERTSVSESSVFVSTAPLVSSHLIQQLEAICQKIAVHISEVHVGAKVSNMVLHCKIDANDTIWVMYCSTLRVNRPVRPTQGLLSSSSAPPPLLAESATADSPGRTGDLNLSSLTTASAATVLPQMNEYSLTLLPPREGSGDKPKKQQHILNDSTINSSTLLLGETVSNSSSSPSPARGVKGNKKVGGSQMSRTATKLRMARDLQRMQRVALYNEEEEEEDHASADDDDYTTSPDKQQQDPYTAGRRAVEEEENGPLGSFETNREERGPPSSAAAGTKEGGSVREGSLSGELPQEQEDGEDFGVCALCHRRIDGENDATPVQQKHVLFPLAVVAFFNSNPPGKLFTEDDGLKKGIVPGHIQLLHPNLTFPEYHRIMTSRHPNPQGGPRLSGKEWFGDQYVVIRQSCAVGLQSMTAGIPIDSDGFIRVPQDNGQSSLKPSRRMTHQHRAATAASNSNSSSKGFTKVIPAGRYPTKTPVEQQQKVVANKRANSAEPAPAPHSLVAFKSGGGQAYAGGGSSSSSRAPSNSRSRSNTPATQPAYNSRPATRTTTVYHDYDDDDDDDDIDLVNPAGLHSYETYNMKKGAPSSSQRPQGRGVLSDVSNGRRHNGKRSNSTGIPMGRPPLAQHSHQRVEYY